MLVQRPVSNKKEKRAQVRLQSSSELRLATQLLVAASLIATGPAALAAAQESSARLAAVTAYQPWLGLQTEAEFSEHTKQAARSDDVEPIALTAIIEAAGRDVGVRKTQVNTRAAQRAAGAKVARTARQGTVVSSKPALATEQRNIARFVADKYRIKYDEVQRFVGHAYDVAGKYRLDPHLVLAVISIESNFNPKARSNKGAQGLMQVHTRVHTEKFASFGGAKAAFDPVANLHVGAQILRQYLDREGSVERALKSYVGAALLRHDFGYGKKVLGERARIVAAATGATTGTTAVAKRREAKPAAIERAAADMLFTPRAKAAADYKLTSLAPGVSR